jgi:hypothetical protein
MRYVLNPKASYFGIFETFLMGSIIPSSGETLLALQVARA